MARLTLPRLSIRLRLALGHTLIVVGATAMTGALLLIWRNAAGWPSLLIGLIVIAVVSFAANYWLTARALSPVAEITRAAKQIAATARLEERVPLPPAHDELRELVGTLNEMLARLERNVRRQRQFLADASHELRGRLMVIRGNLDLLQMDLPPDERKAGAREASEEADRIARLVGDLLFLAEEDAHERLQSAPVPLHEVLTEVWQRPTLFRRAAHQISRKDNPHVTRTR